MLYWRIVRLFIDLPYMIMLGIHVRDCRDDEEEGSSVPGHTDRVVG